MLFILGDTLAEFAVFLLWSFRKGGLQRAYMACNVVWEKKAAASEPGASPPAPQRLHPGGVTYGISDELGVPKLP